MHEPGRFAVFCLATLLFACSAKEEPEGVLTEAQERSMERADEVEGVLQQSAEQRREESEAY